MTRADEHPESAKPSGVIDPTSQLLGEVPALESRMPWAAVGIAALCILWLPIVMTIADTPLRGAEVAWVEDSATPWEPGVIGTGFARTLTRATWEWGGVELTGADAPPLARAKLRIPSMACGLAALLIFYFLGRLLVGNAAALLGACLLAIAGPWREAGSSAQPLIIGEMLVLLGVAWAITLQSRHREVQVAGATAVRIGIAGLFLGVGLLLAPAAFATLVTTLLVWFLLGLRRASSDATTVPVVSPGQTRFFAIAGTVVLAGAALLAAWTVEVLIGGGSGAFPVLFPAATGWEASQPELWPELYQRYLAPTPALGWLVAAALPVVFILRWIEWSGGRPWQTTGLLPWLFVGVYLLLAFRGGDAARSLSLPVTVPPLFILGLGWLILRGLRPGRFRRQEYTFLLTWLSVTVLLAPVAPAGHPRNPFLAASVTLLPAVMLAAARGARALWETEDAPLSRAAVLVLAYLPVAVFAVRAAAELAGAHRLDGAVHWIETVTPPILLAAVALGIVSQLMTVRPGPFPASAADARRRRGRRGGRRRGARGGRKRGSRH